MFVLIWRYTVRPEHRAAFAEAYGPTGIWAQTFAEGAGFVRTELYQDPADAGAFLTLDFWDSAAAFADYFKTHGAAYCEIDAGCETLTEAETFVGAFDQCGTADARAFYPAAADREEGAA